MRMHARFLRVALALDEGAAQFARRRPGRATPTRSSSTRMG